MSTPRQPVSQRRRRRRGMVFVLLVPLAAVGLVVVAMFGFALALGGSGDLGCTSDDDAGAPGPAGPDPTRAAVSDIPRARLALYRRAGRAQNIDWTFLASIGAQECDHGACRGDNGSGCAGPMQIAMRRRSPCSPGSGPTLWERYGVDGNHDGHRDVNDPADAVLTAARILKREKKAPATGGTYAAYREAACAYYGACADAAASYADEVMRRAVQYGFHGAGSPDPSDAGQAKPAPQAASSPSGGECAGVAGPPVGGGKLGPVQRSTGPRHLIPLPASAVAPGTGPIRCDARIIANVVYLARRFGVRVTSCFGIHSLAGEHPLGAAVDLVPVGGDWNRTRKLAQALGWKRSCAASGVAPECARLPFRFIGYDGYPNHGDPTQCVPCSGGPHLHLSWLTSASQGESENRSRTGYFAPAWIDVFDPKSDTRRVAGGRNG